MFARLQFIIVLLLIQTMMFCAQNEPQAQSQVPNEETLKPSGNTTANTTTNNTVTRLVPFGEKIIQPDRHNRLTPKSCFMIYFTYSKLCVGVKEEKEQIKAGNETANTNVTEPTTTTTEEPKARESNYKCHQIKMKYDRHCLPPTPPTTIALPEWVESMTAVPEVIDQTRSSVQSNTTASPQSQLANNPANAPIASVPQKPAGSETQPISPSAQNQPSALGVKAQASPSQGVSGQVPPAQPGTKQTA